MCLCLKVKGGNLCSNGARHGVFEPGNVVVEAGGASANVHLVDAANSVKDGQVVAADAQKQGLPQVNGELVYARKGLCRGGPIVGQFHVERHLDVEAADERHEGVGLPHGRVPAAQARERGQQGRMGDEHVFRVEKGRGLVVDLAAGEEDGWVDVDGGERVAGGHFVDGGG